MVTRIRPALQSSPGKIFLRDINGRLQLMYTNVSRGVHQVSPNENHNLRISVVFLAAATFGFGARESKLYQSVRRFHSKQFHLSQTDIKHYQNVIAFNKIELKEKSDEHEKSNSKLRDIGGQANGEKHIWPNRRGANATCHKKFIKMG